MIGGGDVATWLVWSLYLVPAVVIAIPGHEIGHALAAYRMGDRSVLAFGYLRPQIRRFIDPYGVVAVFFANTGWGRPVPIQAGRVGYGPRRALYSLAGPGANLLLAVVFGAVLRFMVSAGIPPRPTSAAHPLSMLAWLVFALYFLNLSIFAFQLLPVPGLDGWEIVAALFRRRSPNFFMRVEFNKQTIWIVCFIAAFLGPLLVHFDVLGAVIGIFFEPFSSVILGTCARYISLNPCPL